MRQVEAYGYRDYSRYAAGGSGSELISAATFAFEPFFELELRDWSRRMQVDPLPAGASDAAPATNKRQILEQGRFDRDHVEAGHVLRAIDPFEHENLKKGLIVRVYGHAPQVRRKTALASNE
jgi:hypothetical protein